MGLSFCLLGALGFRLLGALFLRLGVLLLFRVGALALMFTPESVLLSSSLSLAGSRYVPSNFCKGCVGPPIFKKGKAFSGWIQSGKGKILQTLSIAVFVCDIVEQCSRCGLKRAGQAKPGQGDTDKICMQTEARHAEIVWAADQNNQSI